jgi:hypothetical protein
MKAFLLRHKCNDVCEALGLEEIKAANLGYLIHHCASVYMLVYLCVRACVCVCVCVCVYVSLAA